MKAALSAFRAGLGDLRRHLEAIQIEWELLAAVPANPSCCSADEIASRLRGHIDTGAAKRRFDYNSIIISLYGLLEQYVENLVQAYVARLNAVVPKYSQLPDSLRNSHNEVSFTLLNRIQQSRYRGTMTAERLIGNLHSCMRDSVPYTVNSEAFSSHSANFRTEVIDSTLARVGVQSVSRRLFLFPPFSDYVAAQFPGRDPDTITSAQLYELLDDLAERRNEVAHGSPAQLLSNEILLDYISYFDAYGPSLYELLYSESLHFEAMFKGKDLGSPIAVFNNSIVCVELDNIAIKVGDTLVAVTGNSRRSYIGGPIQELQVDNAQVQNVPAGQTVKVGARVDYRTKGNHNFILIPK